MISSKKVIENAENFLKMEKFTNLNDANAKDLHSALAKACLNEIHNNWEMSKEKHNKSKAAFYLSAEFLMGRAVYNNLFALGILEEIKNLLSEKGVDINMFEEIDDDALGNGGLGRLAACFLDSAATHDIPLDGYGIRYKYGLFKQTFENGFQKENPDDWQRFSDPWSIRRDDEKVVVEFAKQKIYAVPYDIPIIGYETKNINTLRLWQSEPINDFDFDKFNEYKYEKSVKERNDAEMISMVLYPNDGDIKGKKLRIKQEYFFASASIKDLIRKFKKLYGNDFSKFPEYNAVQLNDTHPTVAIPEFIRILVNEENIDFDKAFSIAQKTFSYTNHTIMAEALEKWDSRIYKLLLPQVYEIIVKINDKVNSDFIQKNLTADELL
ncbi:MAG: glycogen/starch/alpha-glucan phosphorylase, partial [Oscillospiraceae bacterium]